MEHDATWKEWSEATNDVTTNLDFIPYDVFHFCFVLFYSYTTCNFLFLLWIYLSLSQLSHIIWLRERKTPMGPVVVDSASETPLPSSIHNQTQKNTTLSVHAVQMVVVDSVLTIVLLTSAPEIALRSSHMNVILHSHRLIEAFPRNHLSSYMQTGELISKKASARFSACVLFLMQWCRRA